jgi:hypothetical protein
MKNHVSGVEHVQVGLTWYHSNDITAGKDGVDFLA